MREVRYSRPDTRYARLDRNVAPANKRKLQSEKDEDIEDCDVAKNVSEFEIEELHECLVQVEDVTGRTVMRKLLESPRRL